MATGTLVLPIAGAIPADGSASNAAPEVIRVKGSATAPAPHFVEARFDAAADEHLWWAFRMPSDYASAPVVVLQWKANATANSAVWGTRLGAVTPSDADTPNEHATGTAQTTTTATNVTEARRLNETSITITNTDSVAVGDWVALLVYRDADNGSDTLAVDAELIAVSLEYTTT
jgi:hypothetical protein